MKLHEFIMHFAVTGVASVPAKTLEYPMERVKMILQNQASNMAVREGKVAPYNGGLVHSLKRIIKTEGFFSLWRGNMTSIARYVPQQMLNFTFYSFFQEQLQKYGSNILSFFWQKFLAGGLAGGAATVFVYPLVLCQTKIATDLGSDLKGAKHKRELRGFYSCVKVVKKENGFWGLYRGVSAVMVGVCMYRSIYFSLYDFGKSIKTGTNPENLPILYRLVVAQIASLTSSTVAYPVDTVARRLMVDTGKPKDMREFRGIIDCTRKLYTKNGVSVFFWGAKANAIRSVGGAIMLVLNDELIKIFKTKFG